MTNAQIPRLASYMIACLIIFECIIIFPSTVRSDFVYKDFNETTGLSFVGDAATTSCVEVNDTLYGDVQAKGDRFNYASAIERSETTDFGTLLIHSQYPFLPSGELF